LALLALAAAAGFWYVRNKTRTLHLSLGAGVELKYRKGLTDILCDEATQRDLDVKVQWAARSVEAIERVDRHELDAAVIPAGLAVPGENVRQVTLLDCEAVHLFVRPEIYGQGLAGLRGKRIHLGAADTGARIITGEILQFLGMRPGEDYVDDSHAYDQLARLTPAAMPDAIFSLSPLPSPMGDRLAGQFGYRLLELPLGESLALRRAFCEDTCIPPCTYGGCPAVPDHSLHTVGIRAMLIAHRSVSPASIERLLEVLYESDWCQRAGIRPLSPSLLQRSGEYPAHAGTFAYLHRNDPWLAQRLFADVQTLSGSTLSVISAVLLTWQWLRRRQIDVSDCFTECHQLDLGAQRAAAQGAFDETELCSCMTELARLKALILERQQEGLLARDKQLAELAARIEGLQESLPNLVRTGRPADRISLAFPPMNQKAG
jgi:TRAP-type uncharacterized transport system substrate-binding protein